LESRRHWSWSSVIVSVYHHSLK